MNNNSFINKGVESLFTIWQMSPCIKNTDSMHHKILTTQEKPLQTKKIKLKQCNMRCAFHACYAFLDIRKIWFSLPAVF